MIKPFKDYHIYKTQYVYICIYIYIYVYDHMYLRHKKMCKEQHIEKRRVEEPAA